MRISEFLDTLSVEEEDRVLTRVMKPGAYFPGWMGSHDYTGGPCLVGTVCDVGKNQLQDGRKIGARLGPVAFIRRETEVLVVEDYYDAFCAKFGTDVTNTAIRNRILRNRLRRSLSGKPSVAVPHLVGK